MRLSHVHFLSETHTTTYTHRPVAVTMKGPRLAHAAVLLIAAISAVQLVVASLRHWVTHRPASKVDGWCSLSWHATGKLVQSAAPASLFILSSLRTVPFPIAALLLGKATSCCSPTPTFPWRAVAPNMECGVKAAPLRVSKCLILQWQQASMWLNLDWFGIWGAINLSKCRRKQHVTKRSIIIHFVKR